MGVVDATWVKGGRQKTDHRLYDKILSVVEREARRNHKNGSGKKASPKGSKNQLRYFLKEGGASFLKGE